MSLSARQRQRLVEMSGELQEMLGGCTHADGCPKTFAELEDECVEAADLFAGERELPEDACRCPECQRPGERLPDAEQRLLQADCGDVAWQEPAFYCRRCRRSFFPSVG
jgi:hypothetical protein